MNSVSTLLKTVSAKRPIIGFAVVGGISTVLDVAVYTFLLHVGVGLFWATAAGFLVGLTNGYFLNTSLVFAIDHSSSRYLKYFVISLGGFLLTEGIVHLLYAYLHWVDAVEAKLIAVVVVFFWNYTLSRLWAFK